MKEYRLLAADMDQTALNSNKELTQRTVNAMNAALRQGKQVVLSTGRSISLIRPYLEQIGKMRYAITSSGAAVTDLRTGERLLHTCMDAEMVKYIIAAAGGRYLLPAIYLDGESYGTKSCVDNAADFGLAAFAPIYRSCMHLTDDVYSYFMQHPRDAEKMNLYFTDENDADEVYSQIKELPIRFTSRKAKVFEMNAPGVSKAEGLKVLCERLGIGLDECIAVGDDDNDREMLSCVGLPVAMGNANDGIKSLAAVIAADCDHDGVAGVIEEYLLD